MTFEALVQANNTFGLALMNHLLTEQPAINIFISPASISVALAMTANGADDETAVALQRTLHLGAMSKAMFNQAYQLLWHSFDTADPLVVLAMVNSLWAEPQFPFAAQFLQQVTQHYAAKITNLDFSDVEAAAAAAAVINQWVAEQTKQKIPDLVSSIALLKAVLVLVNAIYFKGEWQAKFDKNDTTEGKFHLAGGETKTLPMMRQTGQFAYDETPDFQVISLPFGHGRFRMVVLLPAPHLSLASLLRDLTPETWGRTVGPLRYSESTGTIVLPRFKAAYKRSLLPDLVKLGFSSNRFPNMAATGELLFISGVIHKAVLEVNEEGAEAAAATAVIFERCMPSPPFRMVVDRPFFCVIEDSQTGIILFTGAIYEPGEIRS
ncbi:MAG: serpin family protein [Chloroflexi bacterium]|nr:serpin family protein [Chloroflexota bacterium]MBP7041593.1 serpin family protein [Chloroflexota bacterium]